jgi:hypothetical protein
LNPAQHQPQLELLPVMSRPNGRCALCGREDQHRPHWLLTIPAAGARPAPAPAKQARHPLARRSFPAIASDTVRMEFRARPVAAPAPPAPAPVKRARPAPPAAPLLEPSPKSLLARRSFPAIASDTVRMEFRARPVAAPAAPAPAKRARPAPPAVPLLEPAPKSPLAGRSFPAIASDTVRMESRKPAAPPAAVPAAAAAAAAAKRARAAPPAPARGLSETDRLVAAALVKKLCTKDGVLGGQVTKKWLCGKMHPKTRIGGFYLAWKNARGSVGSRTTFLSELVSEDVVRVVD